MRRVWDGSGGTGILVDRPIHDQYTRLRRGEPLGYAGSGGEVVDLNSTGPHIYGPGRVDTKRPEKKPISWINILSSHPGLLFHWFRDLTLTIRFESTKYRMCKSALRIRYMMHSKFIILKTKRKKYRIFDSVEYRICKSALRIHYTMHNNHLTQQNTRLLKKSRRNIKYSHSMQTSRMHMPLGIRSPYRACCPSSRPSIPSTQNTIKEQETKSGSPLCTHNNHMLPRKDLHHAISAPTDNPPAVLAPHDGTYPFPPHEAMAREFLDATPLFEAP